MGSSRLSTRQSSRLRQVVIICVGLLALYVFISVPDASLDSSRAVLHEFSGKSKSNGKSSSLLTEEMRGNRFLTSEQCAAAFPGLTKDVDDVVAKGSFTLEESGPLGPLIARIRGGKLSIIHAASVNDLSRDMLLHRTATLHQIHNALITSPSFLEIPDTVFAFTHHDNPSPNTLAYSRPADPSRNGPSTHYFPIPHFGFWSWPLPFIKSIPDAITAISSLEEEERSWSSKIPKAIWRGTPHFNSPSTTSARLRQDLLMTAADKPWSDIEALRWTDSGRNASNALPISEFCRYRYIVHTEGVTYSGRMPFHQLCASVVLTPPLSWMQHTSHLVRPVFSSSLPGVKRVLRPGRELGNGVVEKVNLAKYPAPWVTEAWGRGVSVEEANMIFVAPDWSDLEAVVMWLEDHPKVAEGIARRQRETFHGGGYFTPAAEMCYWRSAIRGWSKVVDLGGHGYEKMEGVPFEEFIMTQTVR